MGRLTTQQEERVAELQATLEVEVDGDKVGFRMLRPTIANEPDREKRRGLELARCEVADQHLDSIYLEAAEISRAAVHELGAASYHDLHVRFGFRLEELAAQCRAFLASTEMLFEQAADRLLQARVGVSLPEAERWDTPRVFRAPPSGTRTSRASGCCLSSRSRSPISASISRPSATSSSTSSSARRNRRAHFAPESRSRTAWSSSSTPRAASTTGEPSSTRQATQSTSPTLHGGCHSRRSGWATAR